MSVDFSPLHIWGADSQYYTNVRPSLIPKPFVQAMIILDGEIFAPGMPEGYSLDQILGYDAAVRVGINMTPSGTPLGSDRAYRLITLMEDGKKWSRLIYLNGDIKESWM